MLTFRDRDLNEISMTRWIDLIADREYAHVASEKVGDRWVSTAWIGTVIRPGNGPFETMLFPEVECWRWGSLDEALAGHQEILTLVRAMGEVTTDG